MDIEIHDEALFMKIAKVQKIINKIKFKQTNL